MTPPWRSRSAWPSVDGIAPAVAGAQQQGDQLGIAERLRSLVQEPFAGLLGPRRGELGDDTPPARGRRLHVAVGGSRHPGRGSASGSTKPRPGNGCAPVLDEPAGGG